MLKRKKRKPKRVLKPQRPSTPRHASGVEWAAFMALHNLRSEAGARLVATILRVQPQTVHVYYSRGMPRRVFEYAARVIPEAIAEHGAPEPFAQWRARNSPKKAPAGGPDGGQ